MNRRIALAYALACHGLFALGVGGMMLNLFFGMQLGIGPTGAGAVVWNSLLVAQFVVLHSWLLSPAGRKVLRAFVAKRLGGLLDTTVFAALSSAQVGLLFCLWSPLSSATVTLTGGAWWLSLGAYLGASLMLLVSMSEAGLGVQLGYTGWTALWRGDRPRYPRDFASTGLHGLIRHPIYLSFALLLWLGPVWSLDKLLLAVPLSLYCFMGPRRKEARYLARYGETYADYLARTPAFIPGARPLPGLAVAPAQGR